MHVHRVSRRASERGGEERLLQVRVWHKETQLWKSSARSPDDDRTVGIRPKPSKRPKWMTLTFIDRSYAQSIQIKGNRQVDEEGEGSRRGWAKAGYPNPGSLHNQGGRLSLNLQLGHALNAPSNHPQLYETSTAVPNGPKSLKSRCRYLSLATSTTRIFLRQHSSRLLTMYQQENVSTSTVSIVHSSRIEHIYPTILCRRIA